MGMEGRLSIDAGRGDGITLFWAERSTGRGLSIVRSSRSTLRGFTLLEIVLVVALIAAASLVAAAVLTGGVDRMRLHASAKEIAAHLRYTRTQAIATGRQQRFAIDPAAHTWEAPNGKHGKIPLKLGVRFIGAREAQARAGEGGFLFFADGASTGGRVQLTTNGAAWNIDVAWLTGDVTIHRGRRGR